MDYKQALVRTNQMHIQIGIKEYKITIIYDFAKVVKVDTCVRYMYDYKSVGNKDSPKLYLP